jgi:ankyrin repeat protein
MTDNSKPDSHIEGGGGRRQRMLSRVEENVDGLVQMFQQALLSGDVQQVRDVIKRLKKSSRTYKGSGRLLQNWRDDEQLTALHVAVEKNNLPLVEFLVSKSADVNDQKNKTKCTPLVLASSKGNLEICRYLLQQKKVDVNALNIDSTSALHYLVRHCATKSGDLRLLTEIYRLLIKRKADLNGENFKGESPLHQATRVGNEGAIGVLIKNGANINHQNRNCETPLHYAVMLGRAAIVQQLLGYGADKTITNAKQQTPLDIALAENREEIVKILQTWSTNAGERTEEKERITRLRRYERMVTLFNEVHIFAQTLSLWADKPDYDRLAKIVINLSIPLGTTMPLIRSLIEAEFSRNASTASVLRGNCLASKVTGIFSRQIGQGYLIQCVGDVVTDLVLKDDKVSFELDPNKLSDEPDTAQSLLEKNRNDLLTYATSLLRRITSDEKIALIPREIRATAGFIAESARNHCPEREISLIGGFIMLRLINPSLVAPESYGMLPLGKSPSPKSRRNLIMVTKLLQNLSNNVEFGVKEAHMVCVNSFIEENAPLMNDFLARVARDPNKKPDEEEWADCRYATIQSAFDVTLLDLDDVTLLHGLLWNFRDQCRQAVKEERDRGMMSDKDHEKALMLFKQVESLGAPTSFRKGD